MKVLITGSTGFIGRYLTEDLIKNGYEVSILTRQKSYKNKDIDVFYGDITKIKELMLFSIMQLMLWIMVEKMR